MIGQDQILKVSDARFRLIDLNQIPENFESLVRRLLGKAVQLTVRTSSTPLHVEVDPTQIEQVLMNLAVNARDVMEQGGEFTIETRLATMEELDDEAHQQVDAREHVLMVVSDTGSGMSESVKEHIFEPFFTTKEEGKGTGLGLATCYGIV